MQVKEALGFQSLQDSNKCMLSLKQENYGTRSSRRVFLLIHVLVDMNYVISKNFHCKLESLLKNN